MDWDKTSEELRKPLSPDAIKPPPQGKYGQYVDALHVIREANRIFGENGWRYDVRQLSMTNATNDGGKHRIGYFALVEVNVAGVTRTDVGHGQGFGKSEGDAHDSAVKEAVTDALKRALRTFGNTFGLALYEKDESKREVGYTADANEVQAAIDAIKETESLASLKSYFTDLYKGSRIVADDLKVVEAKNLRRDQLAAEERHDRAAG